MKAFKLTVLSILLFHISDAQIFKKIAKKAESDAEWRIKRKANQEINKGLDSLLESPKKTADNKKTTGDKVENPPATQHNNKKVQPVPATMNASKPDDVDMTPADGYLTLQLSANKTFPGGSILISGESVKYKNFNQVEINVQGKSTSDVRKVNVSTDGKYNAEWVADKVGEYTVTVQSTDKKAKQSVSLSVEEMEIIFDDEWPEENIKETNKAYDKVKEAVEQADRFISPKDKAEMDKKVGELKTKVDAALLLYKDLNVAAKEITALTKMGKRLSPNLAGNLSALNNNLVDQAKQMKKLSAIPDHQAQDNTVCEYLVMVSEACAAFSTFTNFWSKSIKTILLNVTLDKGVPKGAEIINAKVNVIPSAYEILAKEPAKIYATALADAESLTTKVGTAGFVGDITQFAADFMVKKYCGIFKGDIKHDYEVNFRNNDGVTWWKYGVEMQGVLSLRYPKDKGNGKVIKMKGNLEGNATKFTFYENVEADDSFQKGTKGKIEVVELRVIKPLAIPFASSMYDAAGFGAAARTIATPACFNLVLDAEYDVDADKVKIYITNSLVDFTPAVINQLIFLEVGADLFPYIKWMKFPIHKSLSTLSSVVRDHNEFSVVKDSKGNPGFTGKANKHLGSPSDKIEHDLNFTITAKKE